MQNRFGKKAFFAIIIVMAVMLSLGVMIGCGSSSDSGGGGGDTPDPGTGNIYGTVYDSSGLPVSGAKIVYEQYGQYASAGKGSTVYSDSNGEFTFYNVPVIEFGNVLLTATYGNTASTEVVQVTDGGSTTATLSTQPSGTLSGEVYDASNSSALEGALVDAVQDSNVTLSYYTGSNGSYTFAGLYEGNHTVNVTLSGYNQTSCTVTITEGGYLTKDIPMVAEGSPTPTSTSTTSPTPSPTSTFSGKVHALFVGICDYPGSGSDLDYPVADVNGMKANLTSSAMWKNAEIITLTDSNATKSAIANAISTLKSNAASNDLFFFYFSGHGSNSSGVASIVVWENSDFGYIDESELNGYVSGMPCASAFYFDSCHSGGFVGKALTKVVNGKKMKAKVYTGAPGYDPNFKGTFNPTKGLNVLTNLVGVSASTLAELSWESSSIGHGVFTYYVMEGLGTGATAGPADKDGSGVVSAEESYAYCSPKVVTWSSGEQNPQMCDNYTSGSLPVKQ
ncbi:MAG: carboxypeptidase regulatory-like domain-containing protein [Firmicutes bacterium]|nr:carboxypeptidase regulatory-like domain-containing protein [Bacillota bacterium]